MLRDEDDIVKVCREDSWIMDILRTVEQLQLPDWWIAAGFVRSKIWDVLHDFSDRTPLPDIDVIYFDPENRDETIEKKLEDRLHQASPNLPWSVKNQARMHVANRVAPYTSSVDAMAKFPETVTALGVKLAQDGAVILAAPCGIHDVIHCEVKPTSFFLDSAAKMQIYKRRINTKKWHETWPQITYRDE